MTEIFQSYLGLVVYMDLAALNEMMDESQVVSGVHFTFDESRTEALYTTIKGLPTVASIALQRAALAKFRETIKTAIGMEPPLPPGLAEAMDRVKKSVVVPATLDGLSKALRTLPDW